ncbi:cupin domain-containing protein [Streptomyces sp. NPDC058001]|uniref:cupin domain-containing protein n=1 Tax=Streptomyces sp. NPDC058001 TaxID=3346300 RepID=UPI0036E42C64
MTAVVRRFASMEPYSPPHHSRTTNRRIFGPDDGAGDLVLVRGTLEPGGRADPHYHKHCDQLLFVIAGSCRVRVGETDEVLGANDTAFLPREVPHVVDVLGEATLELLITYLPALRPGDTHPVDQPM